MNFRCVVLWNYSPVADKPFLQGASVWNKAVEVFVMATVAGIEPNLELCKALLVILDQADAAYPAAQLLHQFLQEVMYDSLSGVNMTCLNAFWTCFRNAALGERRFQSKHTLDIR